jgi:hypothetical protein
LLFIFRKNSGETTFKRLIPFLMTNFLNDIFSLKSDTEYYTVFNVRKSSSFYFGKDPSENIIFLIKPSDSFSSNHTISSKGKYLDISYELECEFLIDEDLQKGVFTMLTLKTQSKLMRSIFVRFCEDLIELIGEKPPSQQVLKVVNGMREMFLNFIRPSTKSEIGLWGELLIISIAKNKKYAIDSWHLNPRDTFDFNDGHNKLEVKTTIQNQRVHSFSLNQVIKILESNALICSVMTSKIELGKDIYDLTEIISKDLNLEYQKKFNEKILLSAGDKFEQYKNRFDYHSACRNIAFYFADEIPIIDPKTLDPRIMNIKYSVNLDNSNKANIQSIKKTCFYLP